MLDIKFLRENPDVVKENIRKKFQDAKLPLVDEVISLDADMRAAIKEADELRANRNKISKMIGGLIEPTSGRIVMDGQPIDEKGAGLLKYRRSIGFVF